MKIQSFEGSGYGSNCYAAIADNGECAIIDPSFDYEYVARHLPPETKIRIVLLTHGHFDHILELASYFEAGIGYAIMSEDAELVSDSVKNASLPLLNMDLSYEFPPQYRLMDKDKINIGELEISVMATPGHTKGSCIYICEDAIFSGDTFFSLGDVGRCDLYSGDYKSLLASIEKIMSLDKNYTVYPGHGDSTELFLERIYHNKGI